tara:strand:- start:397 stop:849 length:453 start_codon:yes stop_codon:yes gene_type:complete
VPSDVDIAHEIAQIFAALESLHEKGLPGARANKVRREVIHFLWEIRAEAKFSQSRPHSLLARAYRESGAKDELTYEHSIPLATIMPRLRSAAGDGAAMLDLLKRYVQPVIVLKSESKLLASAGLNASLPLDALDDDRRSRYLACGIAIET